MYVTPGAVCHRFANGRLLPLDATDRLRESSVDRACASACPGSLTKKMKTRTLVSSQLYFGMEPVALVRGAARTLARISDLPLGRAFVSVETLGEDFQLDGAAALKLLRAFVARQLLEPEPDGSGEYRVTARVREFAQAHIVPPLTRDEARKVVDRACSLAEDHNAKALRNPLFIDRMAVSGSYMNTATDQIGKLALWPVVRLRNRGASRPPLTENEGAHEIRAALRELAPHIVVQIVADTASVERPFGVPFEAGNELPPEPTTTAAPLLDWAASLRRRFGGR